MNMKDMLSKLNKIESKQMLNEDDLSVNRHDVSEAEYIDSVENTSETIEENISLNADGDDAMHLILKLAGLPTEDAPGAEPPMGAGTEIVPAGPVVDMTPPIRSHIDTIDDMGAEPMADETPSIEDELDEYANTPDGGSEPATLGLDAALPSGNDLSKSKGMHKHGYHQGDNPLAMEEISKLEGKLAKMFEAMSKE